MLTTTVGTTGYVYDDADRLLSVDGVACAYDNRGNLLSDGTWTYPYDGAGRLVRAETITTTQVYTYSGDGLVVAQSIDGIETSFTWDQALQIPQVLATSDGTKSLYGLERLAVLEGGAWRYPQHDAIGSVRQWTDAAAAVLATQSYSPFGVPRATLAVAPWGFAGEWHDAGGLVYLRATWCKPMVGRFIAADSVRGESENPLSLKLYLYCYDDPINKFDPSGHITFRIGDPTPPPQEFDEDLQYDPNERATWRDRATWLAFGVGAALRKLFIPDAVAAYEHYRSAKATDLQVDYEKAYKEEPVFRSELDIVLSEAKLQGEALYDSSGATSRISITGDLHRIPHPETENWQKTIGKHFVSASGTVEMRAGVYRMQLTIHIRDRYNFNKGQKDSASGIADEVNGRFAVLGWAKSFFTLGELKRTMAWLRIPRCL